MRTRGALLLEIASIVAFAALLMLGGCNAVVPPAIHAIESVSSALHGQRPPTIPTPIPVIDPQ